MVLHIPKSKLQGLLAFVTLTISATYAQPLPLSGRCAVSTVPTTVRAEGITERMGDIILRCSGSNPGAVLTGNLTLFFPVTVTNRVDANNYAQDAVLSVDYGAGFVATATRGLISNNNISFNGMNFTVPSNGSFNLKVSSVRAAVDQRGSAAPQPIMVSISSFLPVDQAQVAV